MREVAPDIFYTGVLNPNMRMFDVIMRTEYGTSYNSYIVKGSEKTAVIEAAHKDFLNYFMDNIDEILGENGKIDYLVLNHTEPDHTGCIHEFVKKYPDIELVASGAAAIYLKNITNIKNLKVKVVKDKESISLGNKTLEFISAPFLHWPDSMFTYVPESKALFTCDFFGAHYCEPRILDTQINYPEAYWESLKYYFDCIFGPFKTYVSSALGKIKDLDYDVVLNSHGPILTKAGLLPEVTKKYYEWIESSPREEKHIPIFYCTAYNGTKALAEKAREGILNVYPDAQVGLYNIIDHDMSLLHHQMNESDAFLIGTLTINKDAVPPIWGLLAGIEAITFVKKPVALFGSFGWSGEAFPNVAGRLAGVKAEVYPEQYKINFVPSDEELKGAVIFGENFAKSLK